MDTIRKVIELFHSMNYATEQAKELIAAIFEYPASAVLDEYVNFYNQTDPPYDWHFWWIFSRFPLEDQLRLIEKAVNSSSEPKTAFDRHIFSESRLLDLLNVDDSQHRILFEIIGYGWGYYIKVCDPSQKSREIYLMELCKYIRGLKK